MTTKNICGDCALMSHNGGICPIFKTPMPQDNSACPSFAQTIVNCSICNKLLRPLDAYLDITIPEKLHWLCANCQSLTGHCATCTQSHECLFETDPSPLPKTIQKESRQGNMIQIATVKNPSRIEITCKKGCPCFSEEFECLRQNNCCSNYKCMLDEE